MALSNEDVNRVALVAAATTLKVMTPYLEGLALRIIAGTDQVADDEHAEVIKSVADLRRLVLEVQQELDDDHGPA